MEGIGDLIQRDDWKNEKHVPVIEIKGDAEAGKALDVCVSVGKEISHPNTTEHHISWIKLFFKPDGEKNAINLGNYQFAAHGESVKGPNEGSAKAEPYVATKVTLEKPGTLVALSYCNIHGLWESTLRVDM